LGVRRFHSDSARAVVLILFYAICPLPSRAQWNSVYRLGEDFAKQLNHDRVGIVAVADPSWTSNPDREFPHYLGVSIDTALRDYGKSKDKLQILQHDHVHETLARLHISDSEIGSADSQKLLATASFAEVIVYGSLENDQSGFKVTFSAEKITDGKILVIRSVSFPKTPFTDCLTNIFPPPGDSATLNSKDLRSDPHYKMPTCLHCPIPSRVNPKLGLRLHGTSAFNVLISENGTPDALQLVRLLGYSQDEKAVEELSKWRFHPATHDGKPIRMIVPVEVTFH
jgi:hypothetical protein